MVVSGEMRDTVFQTLDCLGRSLNERQRPSPEFEMNVQISGRTLKTAMGLGHGAYAQWGLRARTSLARMQAMGRKLAVLRLPRTVHFFHHENISDA